MSRHKLTVRCAWCDAVLRVSPATVQAVGDSHGICRPCAAKVLASMGVSMERDADGVSRPRYLEPPQPAARQGASRRKVAA